LARNSRRSASRTVTSFAPSTTCALVRMMPSGFTMKPEPRPRTGTPPPRPPGPWKRRRNSPNGHRRRREGRGRYGARAAHVDVDHASLLACTIVRNRAAPGPARRPGRRGRALTGAARVAAWHRRRDDLSRVAKWSMFRPPACAERKQAGGSEGCGKGFTRRFMLMLLWKRVCPVGLAGNTEQAA